MLNFLCDQTEAESLETSKQVSTTVSSSTLLQAGLLQTEPEFIHRMREGKKEKVGGPHTTLPASELKHIRALTKAPREEPLGVYTPHRLKIHPLKMNSG